MAGLEKAWSDGHQSLRPAKILFFSGYCVKAGQNLDLFAIGFQILSRDFTIRGFDIRMLPNVIDDALHPVKPGRFRSRHFNNSQQAVLDILRGGKDHFVLRLDHLFQSLVIHRSRDSIEVITDALLGFQYIQDGAVDLFMIRVPCRPEKERVGVRRRIVVIPQGFRIASTTAVVGM